MYDGFGVQEDTHIN